MRKKFYLSKQFLIDNQITKVLWEQDIPYAIVRQVKGEERTYHAHFRTCKHKYGKTMRYAYISFNNKGTLYQIPVADLSYLLANDIDCIPEGYEVDHINNDPLANQYWNLQLLTHADNIKKRGKAKNQWTYLRQNVQNI